MFFRILQFLTKNLSWTMPATMAIALVYGYYLPTHYLVAFVLPFTLLMVYPMMINLQIQKILKIKNVKLHIIAQFINFLIIPFVAFYLGQYFFTGQPILLLGLLLIALLPTSGMTISWTGFAKGNITAAVIMTVFGLLLGSILAPFYIKFLLGTSIHVPIFQVFKQIFLIIFLPLILGQITRFILLKKFGQRRYDETFKQKFPAISALGGLAVVFVAIALRAKVIFSSPALVSKIFTSVFLLYTISFIISFFVSKVFFNKRDSVALVYGTVMRNLSIALAIVMMAFGTKAADAALVVSVALIIQVQAGSFLLGYFKKRI